MGGSDVAAGSAAGAGGPGLDAALDGGGRGAPATAAVPRAGGRRQAAETDCRPRDSAAARAGGPALATAPGLFGLVLEHRHELAEMARLVLAAAFGVAPERAVGLAALPPVVHGPLRPDAARVRRLIELTGGEVRAFETEGGRALWLPPTAAALWCTPLLARALRAAGLRLGWARVLHAGNEIWIERPASTAEPLWVEVRLAALDATPARVLVLLRAVHRDAAGSHRFTVDTTLYVPGRRGAGGGGLARGALRLGRRARAGGAAPGSDKAAPARGGEQPPRVPYGARELGRFRVRLEDARAYAAISGDLNPIHLVPAAARAAGLPGPIAHGYALKAWLAHRLLAEVLGGEVWRLRRLGVRFRCPVRIDQEVGIYAGAAERTRNGTRLELHLGPGPGERACVTGEAVYLEAAAEASRRRGTGA
ncbi:MAG: hypothetical protein KatS3mg102_2358 [Planctomycetota bacterium]|nr:MAG: hypothetical protein KatS3mg102_2358 [Planctomycetota bacterium]